MNKNGQLLIQKLRAAWESGALVYKDGMELPGVPEFSSLFEDSRYMMDVEDDGYGKIVRINFQKVKK